MDAKREVHGERTDIRAVAFNALVAPYLERLVLAFTTEGIDRIFQAVASADAGTIWGYSTPI